MKDCIGLFSIELNVDTPDEVILFCNNLKHFLKAVSWGGFESLVDPAITVYDFEHPEANELSWRIVRFYCGLESSEILIDDVLQALNILDNGAKNQQK
jgi:cystathionine beta-lyase/cystathionine gamma-synthase